MEEERKIVAIRTRMGMDAKDRMVLVMRTEDGIVVELRVTAGEGIADEENSAQIHDLLHQIPEVFYGILQKAANGEDDGILITGGWAP